MYDVRSIANFVMIRSRHYGREPTNISVNKTVYFLYGWYLAKYQRPVTSAKIEAWDFGPVFRELYHQFKKYGSDPILEPAVKFDPLKRENVVCNFDFSDDEVNFIEKIVDHYVKFDAFDLVELSHSDGGPWAQVYYHEGEVNPGMKISDEIISDYFSRQIRH